MRGSTEQFCIIEIKKEGCFSCSYNGRIFDLLSLKFAEQGLDVPLFRMNIDNQSPYIGRFGYSPTYLFIRKDGREVSEIYTLPTPSTTGNQLTEFLAKV